MISLHGIIPPVPTAFQKDESLFPEKLKENIAKLLLYDMTGVVVLGSNGEKVMLSEKERRSVIENAREVVPTGKLLIAGAGGESTLETIHDVKMVSECGADAAMVLSPSYYRNRMSQEAFVLHYHRVADASPVPVIIYNMPACTGVDLDAGTILEISKHPNIAGIKDSGGNLTKMAHILGSAREEFQYLAGGAGFLLPALSGGAAGGILALANIAPGLCLDIYNAFLEGRLDRARELQYKAVPVNDAVNREGGVPALKAAMDQLEFYGGPVRSPLLPLEESERTVLIKLLDESLV